jgi:hypothetical protein
MAYERPIDSRYLDPVELVWLACCKQLGLTIRRHPDVFSMTDGTGMMWFGPRDSLDADDSLAQMILHELCHWITNGVESFEQRDWGFAMIPEPDQREYACLRLQAWLCERHGLRRQMGPTGMYRAYYDALPADVLEPVDGSLWEAEVVRLAAEAIERSQRAPWGAPLEGALVATAQIRDLLDPFLDHYATEVEGDALPSIWRA